MASSPGQDSNPSHLRAESLISRVGASLHPRAPYQRIDNSGDIADRSSNANNEPSSTINERRGLQSVGLGIDVGTSDHKRSPSSPEHGSMDTPGPGGELTPEGYQLARFYPREGDGSESERLRPQATPSINLQGDHDKDGNFSCPSRRNVVQRRTSWLSLAILFLAFYCTALSGIYLVVACVKPRFGKRVGTSGGLAPSTASLLCAFFAKTIELAFVTVFVSFLGQVLSRRALAKDSRGISIADMSMRGWIMQPGTLITHWENVRYSALSILGMIALTTALMAMLYTTAAETLVSPKLQFGPAEHTVLGGQVHTKFANGPYLYEKCQTPITPEMDSEASGSTCYQIAVGQAYHNYVQYLSSWTKASRSSNRTLGYFTNRPQPVGTWYDNTTVTGNWLVPEPGEDMKTLSKRHGRMINNVTAAMPHAGVFTASRDPANEIRQPGEFDGLGEFLISASVPSPAVNVLCAGMTAKELEPIVYTKFPNVPKKFDITTWSLRSPETLLNLTTWQNKTVVDKIFGFGSERAPNPPVFPKLPMPFNTMLSITGNYPRDSVYLLAGSPPEIANPPYVLCSLKGGLTPGCSTTYHATSSSGQLRARCNDHNDPLVYQKKAPKMPQLEIDPDWRSVAEEWSKSLSLSAGFTDGNASIARLLTQFIPEFNNKTNSSSLDLKLPSIAEALAVKAGSTLLMSTEGAPFTHVWNYTEIAVPPGNQSVYEYFNATVRVSDYVSGGTEKWQGMFYIVLALVFVTSLICLGYMYLEIRGVQLTDFTEPQNMFALALNSPASVRVTGACGGGPEGRQLIEKWRIGMDESGEHYYITSRAEYAAQRVRDEGLRRNDGALSPAVHEYRTLSKARSSMSLIGK